MELYLAGVIIVLVIGAGILSARLWCYRKQIAHIREELTMLEGEDTNRLLTSYCAVGKTDEMISDMNRLLLKYREEVNALNRENRVYRESITSISHDIRTPLTSAKGYIQMVQRQEVSAEKSIYYLSTVEQRLNHLSDMLNQLFEYARIEAGEMQLMPEVFNASNVFAETISMFYEDFVKKGCEPEVVIEQPGCRLYADKQAFVRIVENLLKNALVHGTGAYALSLTVEQGNCVIRVSNETNDVEPGDIDRIFERFYTTDQSRNKKTTGLGLAIVQRFAAQMGGRSRAYLNGKIFTIEVSLPI